ncbi:hypothetical protein QJ48_08895 [Paenibacillus sp. A3]|uniref:hypothetical protein n=1 Tax=Paenibacillus sp. A3 TaxID=1337054 RepID=UPI0006D55F03|nr:hypothetical protein [Paenibacillus sp. A3]KPV59831.1 hypothetical protein QJ48_08895 [Paenibacillus sp. A3]
MGKSSVRALVIVLALAIGAYAVYQYGLNNPLTTDFIKKKLRSPDFHLEPWIYFLYIHIAIETLIRLRWKRGTHRYNGTSRHIR